MRAISFENDTSIWVSKQFVKDKMFGSEVFFQQEAWRYSVIALYQAGSLDRIVIIKENKQDFPSQLDEAKITDLFGTWQLTTTQIKPNLEMSVQKTVAPKINFDSLSENYQKWFLPERILVGLPENIPEGQKFIIIIGKQITKSSYKQIKVEYDVNGKLSNLVSEVYEIVTN